MVKEAAAKASKKDEPKASAKSALLQLCEENAWDEVRAKLKGGRVSSKQLAFASADGLTALALACLEEVLDVVELLLKTGSDPGAADAEGTNCLHIAATLSNAKLLKLLLGAGGGRKVAEVINRVDQAGNTPLHLAVEPADEADAPDAAQCVEVLLKHGASTAIKNEDGKAPLELATLAAVRKVFDAAGVRNRSAGRSRKAGADDSKSTATRDEPTTSSPCSQVDAETLAAYLYRHAETARQRHAALVTKLRTEEAAEAAIAAETAALQAELEQYRGWISETREGGSAYRLSKALVEERERRCALEKELGALRSRLSELYGQLQHAVKAAKSETPQQTQARAADEALVHLTRLRQLSQTAGKHA
jgi:hypothetical protein